MGIEACTPSFGNVRSAYDFAQPKDGFVRTAHATSLSFRRKPESRAECAWLGEKHCFSPFLLAFVQHFRAIARLTFFWRKRK